MTSLKSMLMLCVFGVLCVDSASQTTPIYGFTPGSSATERSIERRFVALPSPARAREAHALLTAEPHVAGTPRDRVLAEWVRDRWKAYGLERVEITEHEVLLPYADDVRVEIVNPERPWRATLKEDPVPGDPFSARDVGVAYHAYSASGDVTASVVYAASGNPADYDWLRDHGIDIKGKIALVRYSVPYSYRGFKALTAEQRGAAGVLIYSDPAEDGFRKGKTYPDGPWGNDSHIQRGGTVYDFRVPGDPLTPGWASLPGAKRIAARDAISLPKIMSAPLSWRDARVILETMQGPEAPEAWQGGIPSLTYRVGPGATVRLRVHNDGKVRPIWTVTGRITGSSNPEDLVIVGNHRDAWVYGGVDPSSGTAAMMELARSLGELARRGVRPKRTIVFGNWDAEEFTLTSSTEWGEQHARELTEHAVAYLNVDMGVEGTTLDATAVPSLNRLLTESAATATGAQPPLEVKNRLGSGSDYTVFLNFLGVPIADLAFTGPYGVYHSIYDNHLWMEKVGDPHFAQHAAMTRLWGIVALRLANADVLPLDFAAYAARLREFVTEIVDRAGPTDRGAITPLLQAADRFSRAAGEMVRRIDRALINPAEQPGTNRALIAVERAFLDPDGIPGRPWYRHLIYAPKPTYAPEVLPGVAEAIEAGDRGRLAAQVARVVAALDRASAVLKR
jgi:N-acetylated-alpha-linked acidic dipeptidase